MTSFSFTLPTLPEVCQYAAIGIIPDAKWFQSKNLSSTDVRPYTLYFGIGTFQEQVKAGNLYQGNNKQLYHPLH